LLKGKGLSEERVKRLCGCKGALLQCQLVAWIKKIQEELVPELQQNKPGSYGKYWADTILPCGNHNKIYEWKHIYQSHLRQFLSDPTLLPLFSLNAKPHLEPVLYNRLKQWAAQGEDYIFDNKDILELQIEEEIDSKQPLSEVYLSMQEKLLLKGSSVKNFYSLSLFLFEHLANFELQNCKGIQESEHKGCLLKGEGLSVVRMKELCGCTKALLHCHLVIWIK